MSNIFEKIIDKHVESFKTAISDDIRKMLSGETVTGAAKKRGRPAGKTAGKGAGNAKAPKADRKPRAPSEAIVTAMNAVIELVAANGGMKSAEIIKKTRLDKGLAIKALKLAINSGKLSKTGETRSTTYHSAASAAE